MKHQKGILYSAVLFPAAVTVTVVLSVMYIDSRTHQARQQETKDMKKQFTYLMSGLQSYYEQSCSIGDVRMSDLSPTYITSPITRIDGVFTMSVTAATSPVFTVKFSFTNNDRKEAKAAEVIQMGGVLVADVLTLTAKRNAMISARRAMILDEKKRVAGIGC